jgi:arsenical pump membrane protein
MDFVAKTPFFAVCTITGATIVGLLFRPLRLPEAVWAYLGALVLILLHLISWDHTLLAVSKGVNVYLFLAGMMLLAELARREGVFDWLAGLAVRRRKQIRFEALPIDLLCRHCCHCVSIQ